MEITTMSQAMQLHARILKSGSGSPENTTHELIKLFTFSALSGNLTYASHVLDSLPTQPSSYFYNTMIRAYSQSPDPTRALHFFLFMHRQQLRPSGPAPRPDKFTYPFVLKACSRSRRTRLGRQVHGLIYKSDLESDRFIRNSLIHMYSGCGESGLAEKVFDGMSDRDVVSWTSMIDGLVDDDRPLEAVRMFQQMLDDRIEPNEATIVSVLRACADTGALSIGRRMHALVDEKREIGLKANVNTALIDMYAKCGCIDSAMRLFNSIGRKDVFAWTAMISGLASHGQCQDATELFDQMEQLGLKPDERTITAVLSACRNVGRVTKGYAYFKSMRRKYGVRPTLQHYGCVVDLLSRGGRLNDAEELIRKMPIKPDAVLWRTLIWACKIHGDIDRGERLMKHLDHIDSTDCGSYVLLGNMYASTGKWHDKARVRKLMNHRGLVKPPGCSRIEVNGLLHEFTAGDSTHVEAEKIYGKMDEIEERLREEGYHPKLSEVLLDIEDEEKAFQLRHHSERLAVAFGLIKLSPGAEIRIVKNLRSCEDCHTVMKLISKIYQREVMVRDRIRYHHFRNGECSCRDYW
ncbi:pentatricopeptide repeat-containing protein At4g21065-like [Malania oleifera]|uniref:pentatricopeptide repeat-containing protein At4g21065-like n=1 Tax=Malania oleifera TaxID=397392 RepID=UPI0025AE03F2|nr:pentatricopeptide repeat-containing protein At4g21065-like [Malania oleifera]